MSIIFSNAAVKTTDINVLKASLEKTPPFVDAETQDKYISEYCLIFADGKNWTALFANEEHPQISAYLAESFSAENNAWAYAGFFSDANNSMAVRFSKDGHAVFQYIFRDDKPSLQGKPFEDIVEQLVPHKKNEAEAFKSDIMGVSVLSQGILNSFIDFFELPHILKDRGLRYLESDMDDLEDMYPELESGLGKINLSQQS